MSTRPETFQWFSEAAEAAIRHAIQPQSTSYGSEHPDAHESYQCDECPAEFGFQPADFRCPLCKHGLRGVVTIHFYPPQPPDDES